MSERVAMLGGTLDAGPRAGGGFRVHATLPIDPDGTGPSADGDPAAGGAPDGDGDAAGGGDALPGGRLGDGEGVRR
jgi:hypothetical protein